MELKEIVKEKYGEAARRVVNGGSNGCCGGSALLDGCCDPITSNLYDVGEAGQILEEALKASLGCGNPTALAKLNAGDTVLDLGSGGGIDVLLSARRVGPTGKAYGLDMTDDMLALARENQRRACVENVEFLKGEIEHIPLPDNNVDVIISNCVINLSGDKDQVLREAFRVLKPGGRFAVSDVVVRGEVPAEIRRNVELWVGCVAGAMQDSEYTDKPKRAGFAAIEIEPTRIYEIEDARQFLAGQGIDVDAIAPVVARQVHGCVHSGRKVFDNVCVANFPDILWDLNQSGVAFLFTDLDLAMTFMDFAENSEIQETKARNHENARKAYDTVLRLSEKLTPNAEQRLEIDVRLAILKTRLQAVGQRF